jgi:hypothetical protein
VQTQGGRRNGDGDRHQECDDREDHAQGSGHPRADRIDEKYRERGRD